LPECRNGCTNPTIGGGGDILVPAFYGTVAGGHNITITGEHAAAGGGENNLVDGTHGTVAGGFGNTASGGWATVPGGYSNTAQGESAFAAGQRAKADHDGAFVWADAIDADFGSTAVNQFVARATGGFKFSVDTAATGLRLFPAGNTVNVLAGHGANHATEGVIGATISGGGTSAWPNSVTDDFGTVGGGSWNTASGGNATVGGGYSNHATGQWATVAGGFVNIASGTDATVAGGEHNHAEAEGATIGGGSWNFARGDYATVGGGDGNNWFVANGDGEYGTVGGGKSNDAGGEGAIVGGGKGNSATDEYGTVAGGYQNRAGDDAGTMTDRPYAAVGGGRDNIASGTAAVVSGGDTNTASGWRSTVPGGVGNTAAGEHSFAAGRRAKALHNGAFVWADATDADFASDAANQFLVRAYNGVRIVRGASIFSPSQAALQVDQAAAAEVGWFYTAHASNAFAVLKVAKQPAAPGNFIDGVERTSGGAETRKFHIANNGAYVAGSDFAEALPVAGDAASYEPGDVLVLSLDRPGGVEKCRQPYDGLVLGVYSTRPGFLGADKDGATVVAADEVPVAVLGIVPVKVTAENGPVQPGELLNTSSTPGHAMRCAGLEQCFGRTLGKALEGLVAGQRTGVIQVLVSLQ
jgi:hypothetical protein